MNALYELNRLEHTYQNRRVLKIDQLAIESGSILGLMGPNGSGKSTLLRLLGLIEKPSRGTVRFAGSPIEPFAPAARFQVTLLPQDACLMKRSVFMNVAYGLKLRKDRNSLKEQVHRALALVGLDAGDFARRPWYALSGGEALRVALAGRLALKPRALLLDEPTAGVDAASVHLIKEAALYAQRKWGTTLVIASHDRAWLYEACSQVLHLFKGEIFGEGEETILFGPWKLFSDGSWGQSLSDSQRLLVSEPPKPEAAAVVDHVLLDERPAAAAPKRVDLQGVVSRLNLARKKGQVFATITVASLSFTVALTEEQMSNGAIYPGKMVRLSYRLDDIRWI